MIIQGIKNFFRSLKYFFTPLGAIALGFVFGLSVFLPGVYDAVSKLVEELNEILKETNVDFTALNDSIRSAVLSLNWNDPLEAVKTILDYEWLTRTLHECIGALVGSTEIYAVRLNGAITVFIDEVTRYAVVLLLFTLLGLAGGFFLTKWLIRRNIARRKLWKFFLVSALDALFNATLVALCVWLTALWKPSIFISSVIAVTLSGFIALCEAYVVHAWRKTEIKTIVNGKNILQLFLTNLIIFLIWAVLVSLAVALTNVIVGEFIGVALAEITFIVISLNGEAYVKSYVTAAVPQGERIDL